ncbi:MAG: hypothetical protein KGL39_45500 [Patescibacteria group bacterium]|nr:hypothetical protein [Patescibacteria group bacterium]
MSQHSKVKFPAAAPTTTVERTSPRGPGGRRAAVGRSEAGRGDAQRAPAGGAAGRHGPHRPGGHQVRWDRDGLIRCRVCRCTEVHACAGGCLWVEEDLCSTCAVTAEGLVAWQMNARRANWAALLRETERELGDVRARVAPLGRPA